MYSVVNKHTFDGDVSHATYIGRGSPLGNPYRYHHIKSRYADTIPVDDPLGAYRRWLWFEWKVCGLRSPAWREISRLAVLPDGVLICFCAPKPCHGDVVARAIEWYRKTHGV